MSDINFKLPIIVGKFYKSICGSKVRIYATDGGNEVFSSCRVHGAIYNKLMGWRSGSWDINGHNDCTNRMDIISEWEP